MSSSHDSFIHSDCNQDDYMSQNYNTDNNLSIDDHSPKAMESQLMADSAGPTYFITCKNKSNGNSSTHQIESHQCLHNEEKLHKCSTCDECFTLECNLKVHQRIHTSDKQFQCFTCDKCFTYKVN